MTDFSKAVKVRRDGPRGWHWIDRTKYDADPEAFEPADPLDHDGNRKKGGSVLKAKAPKDPATSELGDLRKQYRARFGKGPSPKWDADTLRGKIAEAPQE